MLKLKMKPLISMGAMMFLVSSALAAETVTVKNFVRAETDRYLQGYANNGGFGKLIHRRKPTPIDDQSVIRMNRDTLYSAGVFDLSTPVTIVKPDTGRRYQSMQIIDQDHYTKKVIYAPGEYTIDQQLVGTRYAVVLFRTLIDTSLPQDEKAVNDIQDSIILSQAAKGSLELPEWDGESLNRIRAAVNVLGSSMTTNRGMFGDKDAVNPIDHLIGTAYGWGGIPRQEVIYINVVPEHNDGETPYTLTVGEVPVDAFWSVSLYDESGYFLPNDNDSYTVDDRSAVVDADGRVTIRFGGDPGQDNYLQIMDGWNYVIRLYQPREEVLDGSWVFPDSQPCR